MQEQVTYYGVLLSTDTRERPGGLARRRVLPSGGIIEEVFRKDLTWGDSGIIGDWRRGEASVDLVEITEAEAERVMERFRELFGR